MSPDLAGLLANHGVALFASEGLAERFHVGDRSVPAEMRQWVGIRIGLKPCCLGQLRGAPRFRCQRSTDDPARY
jgi:hypothetical protein